MPANVYKMTHHSDVPTPWHGESELFTASDTFDDRIRKAGFNFTFESSPVFYMAGQHGPKVDDSKKAFYRSDTGELYSVMSSQYKPVQPVDMMRFYQQLEDETGCPLHVAGMLSTGKFFATAKIDLDSSNAAWEVAGEKHERYWLIATANDGSMATRVGPTDVQVVCNNTLHMALNGNSGIATVNHRSAVDWGRVRADLDRVRGDFPVFDGLMEVLRDTEVSQEYVARTAVELVAPKFDMEDSKAKVPSTVKRVFDSIAHSPGQRERGQTAYALLSGITHYADHGRRARSEDTRFDSAQFGAAALLKRQALDKLLRDCVDRFGQRERVEVLVKGTAYDEVLDRVA